MARAHALSRDDLDADGRFAFDRIAGERGEVPWLFRFMLDSPELAFRVSHLGDHLRAGTSMPDGLRELLILALSRHLDFQLEWSYHEPLALAAGVPASVITALREGRRAQLSDGQATLVEFAEAVCDGTVVDEQWSRVERRHGRALAVEVVVLVAFIRFMQVATDALGVDLPDGVEPTLPVGGSTARAVR
jgi:4-carboxymuconolactone decarboxylase